MFRLERSRGPALQARSGEVTFRGDAAFAEPELHQALEERTFKLRDPLSANDNLQRNIIELLKRGRWDRFSHQRGAAVAERHRV